MKTFIVTVRYETTQSIEVKSTSMESAEALVWDQIHEHAPHIDKSITFEVVDIKELNDLERFYKRRRD